MQAFSTRRFRRSERFCVALPARCKTRSGFADRVTVRDISVDGCRIESHGLTLSPGDPVVVRPDMLEGLCGTVRWVEGNCMGIAFAEPLYPAVVEHLHRRYANFTLPELPPRHTMGLQMAA